LCVYGSLREKDDVTEVLREKVCPSLVTLVDEGDFQEVFKLIVNVCVLSCATK
jgi:hypothetical protein